MLRRPRARDRLTGLCLTLTSFVGATLVFTVQPMVTAALLPALGGSTVVWSTASLFFQVGLLLAYLWVHLGRRSARFTTVHLSVMVAAALTLPTGVHVQPAPEGLFPGLWVLWLLAVAIGAPYLVLGTTGPLLQLWFSRAGLTRSGDPYFLYAAGNAGSLLGLLAYPFVVEPFVGLAEQRQLWSAGYLLYAALMLGCWVLVRRPATAARPGVAATGIEGARPTAGRRAWWVLLAFLPSAVSLGVTTALTTDLAPVPLLWVAPLAVYLLTWVVTFGSSSRAVPAYRWVAAAVVTPLSLVSVRGNAPLWAGVLLLLLAVFLVGWAAHGTLAAERPQTSYLTAFYVLISVGGALAGLVYGILAPAVLDRPLENVVVVLLLGAVTGSRIVGATRRATQRTSPPQRVVVAMLAVAASLPVLVLAPLPAISAVLRSSDALVTERSYYGSYRVDAVEGRRTLVHGTTVHGMQLEDRPRTPTTYYSRPGPLGDVFSALSATGRDGDVAVVGLGIGTVAAYGRPGQRIDFMEIDPTVARLAEGPGLFTFLRDGGAEHRVLIGDGRRLLAEQRAGSYDLVVLDAFSSDAVPTHLLTREALVTTLDTVSPGGLLAVHISSRHLDLTPVMARHASALGLEAAVREDTRAQDPAVPSRWVVLSRDDSALGALRASGWRWLDPGSGPDWTDDHTSLLSVLTLG